MDAERSADEVENLFDKKDDMEDTTDDDNVDIHLYSSDNVNIDDIDNEIMEIEKHCSSTSASYHIQHHL